MIGKILSHYRIMQKLGGGGMGEVYLAEDTKLRRRVAIKIPPADITSDSDRMRRFIQEARAASALNHSNIAAIYELGDDEGVPFIVMELVEGRTLHEAMNQGPLPEEQILQIAIQAADALQDAHSQGIIHRDIKPANMMLNSKGQLKVLDFGLAKLRRAPTTLDKIEPDQETTTRTGVLLGTVHYLSPEQALGKEVDGRADIFSLGVVLYQLATGEFPFTGDNVVQMIESILHSDPRPPQSRNQLISTKLERIIQKCLMKDPAMRYQNAGELLRDLKSTEPITQVPQAPIAHGKASVSRRWILIPLAILLMLAAALLYRQMQASTAIRAIAVLPFESHEKDPDAEYLTDGLTESIINSLSQLPGMKVLARGTVFTYKGQRPDPRAAGKTLNVDAVVTGDVSTYKQHLIVRTSLVRVSDGVQLWGDQYDVLANDLLEVQVRISGEISSRLREKLTGEQRAQVTKKYTHDAGAYQLYLKGVYFLNKRSEDGFQKAIESFQAAIDKDPNYALAYAGLADCYTLLPAWALSAPSDAHPRARTAAEKALTLDPTIAEAHAALAHTQHNYEWDWSGAERSYRRAIELNPNYATAHHWYGNLLSDLGRTDESLSEKKRALQLDPLSLVINADYGNMMYMARQYDAAEKQLRATLELDPQFVLAHEFLAFNYQAQKKYPQAIAELNQALKLAPQAPETLAELGHAQALAGNTKEAEAYLNKVLALSAGRYVVAFDIAMLYSGLNRKAEALDWLEKAMEERSYQVTSLNVDPRVDSLRGEPRFQALVERLGLLEKKR